MVQIKQILCPVDFSEFSRHALDHAVAIARWYGSEITALHVMAVPTASYALVSAGPVFPETIFVPPIDREEVMRELRRFVDEEKAEGVPMRTMLSEGSAVSEIVRQAEAMPADLLVMGTHGRSGVQRFLLGSVTEKVLRKVTCPVLTVPPLASGAVPVGPAPFKEILCAVDFSDASVNALRYAMSLAAEADARLTLAHVLELISDYEPHGYGTIDLAEYRREYEQSAAERLRAMVPDTIRQHCTVDEVFAVGKAYREILRLAAEQHTELIVVGVQGRSAVDLAFFGSTTQHVLREATCPVLTLRSR